MPQTNTKKIVVAEDDVAMAEITCHKLSSSGFNVRHAENGQQAVDMVQNDPPDVLLLDLMMPELDGFQVLEKIRSNPNSKIANLPVIVLSNLWSSQDILRVQSLKVDDFLVKAYFTPEEILAKINNALQKRRNN
ncbi:MAG: response regulator transcription factor [Patescibacteria group bacterium]|nr:response regulator transcription factor [Patescibacteria group bacterium]